jgi:hypothetical protein
VRYEIRLSRRAERELDRLDKPTQKRMVRRLEQPAEDPVRSALVGAVERRGKSAEVARGGVADYLPGGRGSEDRLCCDDRAPRAGLQAPIGDAAPDRFPD